MTSQVGGDCGKAYMTAHLPLFGNPIYALYLMSFYEHDIFNTLVYWNFSPLNKISHLKKNKKKKKNLLVI